VISDGVAYTVADVMQGTLDSGTAVGNDVTCTASGKTGTTEEQADAWFVGYTPDVSTAVWTGHANDRTPVPGYGADLSAPIWHDYTQAYIDETGNCDDYPEPKEPADLSSYSSDQTIVDSEYDDSTYDETTTPTDPDTGAVEPPVDGTDADGDGFPDDAYAPGADQEPAPTPDG
jgi:penicillin-binding protein 1A